MSPVGLEATNATKFKELDIVLQSADHRMFAGLYSVEEIDVERESTVVR